MKLVTPALQWSYAQTEEDVSPKHLEVAAEQLTLRRDKIHVVDAQNPRKEDESEKKASPAGPEKADSKARKSETRQEKTHPRETRKSRSEISPNLRTIVFGLESSGQDALNPAFASRIFSLLTHIWTHPGLQGQFRVDSSQALRLHAYIRPVRWRALWPPGLDGFRALPPQHVHDLLAVCAISRVWKSRSDLLCHQYVTTHAIARIDVLCYACLSPYMRMSCTTPSAESR